MKSDCSKEKKTVHTYYVFPIIYLQKETNIGREKFVKALNSEGFTFYQGYVKPLYLQPLYQEKRLFKNGYPFTALENKQCKQVYAKGTCPIAEELHFKKIIINEHIRLPHTINDMKSISKALKKLIK